VNGKASRPDKSLKTAILIFLVMRLFFSGWALVALAVNPLPPEPNEVVRPYLGEPILTNGVAGLILGPWQRFDANRYLHIARLGYDDEQNTVFPPLYPLAARFLGFLFGGGATANLIAAILLSNMAAFGLFFVLHRLVSREFGPAAATRTIVYLALFPAGIFLLAPYTESIFILLAVGAVWQGRDGRFWRAGFLGLLAALTRLTGWALVVPLLYEYWRQFIRQPSGQKINLHSLASPTILPVFFPVVGLAGFLLWRWQAGYPSLQAIYARYWFQTTAFPGLDIFRAIQTMFFGGSARAGQFTLYFDFFCACLLIYTTFLTFRKFGVTNGLYSAMLLLFILLPTSEFKPLFSLSRYTLAFFPTFILLGIAGERPWLNRAILYPSIGLTFYLAGQFFSWGWVG